MAHEIYYSLEPNQLATFTKPVKGWRFNYITEDGYLGKTAEVDPDTLEAETATCGYQQLYGQPSTVAGRLMYGNRDLPAIRHALDCHCGYRICDTSDTLAGYVHWLTENSSFADTVGKREAGIDGVAICRVEGYGHAAYRDLTDPEPRGTLRFTNYRLTGTIYIPRTWADHQIPDELADLVAANYPGLTVKRIDYPHTPPGTRRRRAPVPTGDARHHTGRWGRYGAAHALIRHDDRYLLVNPTGDLTYTPGHQKLTRHGTNVWQLPGGALATPAETHLEAALRETEEETLYRFRDYTINGHTETHEDDWEHHTFTLTINGPLPAPQHGDTAAEIADSKWFTMEELRDMRFNGKLDRDLTNELRELFAMFN